MNAIEWIVEIHVMLQYIFKKLYICDQLYTYE